MRYTSKKPKHLFKSVFVTGLMAMLGLFLLNTPQAEAVLSKSWTKAYGVAWQKAGNGLVFEEEKYFSTFINLWSNSFVLLPSKDYLLETYSKNSNKLYSANLYKINSYGTVKTIKNIHFNAIASAKDGGYVGLAVIQQDQLGKSTTFNLNKFNKNGKLEWKKQIIPKEGKAELNLLTTVSDGGYVVGGGSYVIGEEYWRGYLAKYSSKGKFVWELVAAQPAEAPHINSLQPTSDGGVVISGYKTNPKDNSTTAFVTKITAQGQISWEEVFGCDESATFATETKGGDIVVSSNFRVNYFTDPNLWTDDTMRLFYATRITKISSDAGQMGYKIYESLFSGNVSYDQCLTNIDPNIMIGRPISLKVNMIRPLTDGGLLLIGTRSTGIKEKKQVDRMWVRKINGDETVWEREYSAKDGNQYGMAGYETSKGQYAIMGVKKDGQRVIKSFSVK